MNIIYLSPIGQNNPHLFPTYKKTFAEQHHVEVTDPYNCTHLFIEIVSGTIEYDQELLDVIKYKKSKIILFDNREFSQLNKQNWTPIDWLNPDIYFARTMMKDTEYPPNAYPYDWAYFNDCDFPPTDKEELFSRPYDCCFIGVSAPPRENVINALIKDGRLKVKHIFNDHLTRLPHDKWINEYRESKMAIECEGGGLTSEKFLQLFSVCPSLRVTNQMKMAFPFTDGIDCLEISEYPTNEEIEKVVDILQDKDWLYDIYENGIRLIKEKYSEGTISNYILDVLKKNNI